MTMKISLPVICLCVLFSVGSASSQEKSGDTKSRKPRLRDTDKVTYQVLDWKGVEKLVAAQKGKVVVIDIWSTYCLPCVREFPKLVALQKKHKAKIACISVNVNFAGIQKQPTAELKATVEKFLKRKKATIHNVISSDADEELSERLDYASIPIVYVYDKRGKLRRRFDNEQAKKPEDEFTYSRNVIPLVERLLAEDAK